MKQGTANKYVGAAIAGILLLSAAATVWSQEPTYKANAPEAVLTPDKLTTELRTLSDRTAALYGRCGYVEIATVPRYVGPFTKYVMLNKLRPG